VIIPTKARVLHSTTRPLSLVAHSASYAMTNAGLPSWISPLISIYCRDSECVKYISTRPFLTTSLDRSVLSSSRSGGFTSRKPPVASRLNRRLGGLYRGVNFSEMSKICCSDRKRTPDRPAHSLVTVLTVLSRPYINPSVWGGYLHCWKIRADSMRSWREVGYKHTSNFFKNFAPLKF
jgi:hypothetical protein